MPGDRPRGATPESVVLSSGDSITREQWQAIESVIAKLWRSGWQPVTSLPEGLDSATFFSGCRELGLPVRQSGNRLVWQPVTALLDADRIRADAGGKANACDIRVSPLVDSSNERLKQLAPAGASIHALFPEAQWAGRGRRERRWQSRFGESVMLSLRIATGRPLAELPGVAIVAGVAVAGCLIDLGMDGIGLKWPNDVLLDGAKVAGILVEAVGSTARADVAPAARGGMVVVGIGLNWQSPDHLGARWGQPVAGLAGRLKGERAALAGLLLASLLSALERFSTDGLAPFLSEFAALDALAGQAVVVEEQGQRFPGVARGLTADGALRVQHADGERIHRSAQVSLRRCSEWSAGSGVGEPATLHDKTGSDA